jgi:chromosome segregation ATPase
MAKLKLLPYIAIAALAVFAFMGAEIYSANASVKTLTTEVNTLTAEKATKQAEVKRLADELDLADFTLSRLLAERESIAAIRARADAEAERLRIELADAENQVAQLRVSHDEDVKEWANTVVPANAVRLLKYADKSGNPDSDGNKSGLQSTTRRLLAQSATNNAF